MAIGTPYAIGSNTSNAASNTLVITAGTIASGGTGTGHGTTAGDCIVVAADVLSLTETVTNVTDSKSNHYVVCANPQTNIYDGSLWVAAWGSGGSGTNTAALVSGVDTITVTYSSATGVAKNAGAIGCSGLLNVTGAVDVNPTPTTNAGSTTPSITSGTLAVPGELVVMWVSYAHGGGALTFNNMTGLLGAIETASNQESAMGAVVTSSTASVAYTGTILSEKWSAQLISIKAAFAVTTASLPNGVTGVAYSQTLTSVNGSGSVTWSISAGSLPSWASLNTSTGVISGTPVAAAGAVSFTVEATDSSSNHATQPLSITVTSNLTVVTAGLNAGVISVPYSTTLNATGGSGTGYTWSLQSGSVPAGMSLTSGGVISGTPTSTGSSFTVEVTDSASNTATKSLSIIVSGRNLLIPPAGFANFGAYPGPGNAAPGPYQAANMANRPLAVFARYCKFDANPFLGSADVALMQAGQTIHARWGGGGSLSNGGVVKWSDILAGTYDVLIAQQANQWAAYGVPIFISYNGEFDGVPAIAASGPASNFAAAWQHIWNIAAPIAPNVIWGWVVTGANNNAQTASMYPGDAYVDWIGFDEYDPSNTKGGPLGTYTPFMNWLKGSQMAGAGHGIGIPVYLGETGVDNTAEGGTVSDSAVAAWISEVPAALTQLDIRQWMWFNDGQATIVPGSLSASAMASIGANTVFNPGSIAPPSTGPYLVGAATPSLAASSTLVIPVTTTTTTGDGIIVFADINSGGVTVSSVADSQSNTYVKEVTQALGYNGAAFVALSTTQLVAGTDTITVTYSTSSSAAKNAAACGCSGVLTSSAVDIATSAEGTSAAPALATANLAQVTEFAAAWCSNASGGHNIAWTAPLAPLASGLEAAANQVSSLAAVATTSTNSIAAGGSLSASVKWALMVVTLKVASVPAVITSSLPAAFTGAPYSVALTASGGLAPYTWSLPSGSLPAGLSLSSSGVISGTATSTTGTSSFTVEVTDSASQTASKPLSITVTSNLTITTTSLPPGTTGTAYSTTLAATGGAGSYTWAVTAGSLPAGVSLNTATGVLSGTPATAGTASFTIGVTDSASNSATQVLSITVASNLAVTKTSLPGAVTGVAYSQTLTASGGSGTYTWSNPGGGLPSGLSLSGAVISGTPTGSGTSTFVVEVTDAGSNTATQTLSITVSGAVAITTIGPLPTAVPGVSYSTTLTAVGGSAPYTWTISEGTLPPGISVAASTGVISGTPEESGSFSFTAQVTDSLSETDTAFLGINVAGAGPPGTNMDLDVDLNLAGNWTNISGYVMQREGTSPPVTIVRGRPPESAQCNPASANMQWNNRDGRFSRGNPLSPYYGAFGRNTPLRVSIPAGSTFLRIEDDTVSRALVAPASSLNITGDIDIRLDVNLSGYQPCSLVAKWYDQTNERDWALLLNADGTITFWWSPDGTLTGAHSGTSTTSIPIGPIVLRVTLQASGGNLTFWTAPSGGINGSFTALGAVLGGQPSTAIFGGTAGLAIGYALGTAGDFSLNSLTGMVNDFQLQSGVGGTVVAHMATGGFAAAATAWTDSHSQAWTTSGTAEVSDRSYRFHGECSALPQNQDTSGKDIWVPVTASGILRRLQQGSANIQSPFRRAVSGLDGVVAYWPMEDPQGATQFASGIPGGIPMTGGGGTPTFADNEDFVCSNELPVLNGAVVIGSVQPYVPTGTIVVRALIEPDPDMAAAGSNLFFVSTTGSHGTLIVNYQPGGLWTVQTPDSVLFAQAFGIPAGPVMLSVELVQSGSDAVLSIVLMTPSGEVFVAAGLGAAGTAGIARKVWTQPGTGATVAGHFYVQDVLEPLASMAGPLAGWAGETAANRFGRLCAENAITSRIYGFPDISVVMGPQQIDTLQNVLQSCEDADRGQIYDPAETFGLGYRPLSALVNQAETLTPLALAWSGTGVKQLGDGDQMVGTTDDDQFTCNDMTVTRNNGSSYQYQLDDGSAMSISPPPAGAGDYAQAVTQYLNGDYQLPDAAGWLVHTGTCDEERYPVIPLNLARPDVAALTGAIQNARLGDYIQISSPPGYLVPDVIRQIITQTTEQLGGQWWRIAWAAAPESPYETAIYDDPVYGRADTDGSHLHASYSSSVTSIQVTTADTLSPIWTTAAADFPFDIEVAGERMTVTSITGSSSPQTFTVTRSVNGVVKAQAASADVRLWFPPVYALT